MEDLLSRPAAQAALNPGASQLSVLDQLKSLSTRIEATKRALEAQEKRLDALRSSAKDLSSAIDTAGRRVDRAVTASQPLAQPAPVQASRPEAKPRFVLPAVEEEERLRTRADVTFYPDTTPSALPAWTRFMPYAALAAVGLLIGSRVPWQSVSLKGRAVRVSEPAPVVASAAAPAAPAPRAPLEPVDEQTFDEVLQLVYGYVPPGRREAVIELLGPEIDSSPAAAPWVVERGERPGAFHATLRPYGETLDDAPVYEFDVDLKAGLVRALPSTELALKGGSFAASGR